MAITMLQQRAHRIPREEHCRLWKTPLPEEGNKLNLDIIVYT